jgi:RNA polymerase sigma factor (TIGR02999 family)
MKERSELFNEMYDRLRQMARGRLAIDNRNARGDATSLVHEAYIKLRGWSNSFQDEKHFLATASNAMRQILVDRARARRSLKRGANVEPLSVSIETPLHGTPTIVDVLLLDEVLDRMAAFDPRAARITEMRMFLGLSEEEIAADLEISVRTVKRDWSAAKAWLKAEMGSERRKGPSGAKHSATS